MTEPQPQEQTAAITSRRSIRAFLSTPVERSTIEEILSIASRAPSGTNFQPWRVYVLTGEGKPTLSQRVLAMFNGPMQSASHTEECAYYPTR